MLTGRSAAIVNGPTPVASLVQDAIAGDRAAFGELYRRYAGMVYAIALASLDRPAAEDLVQDVFLQALRQLPALRTPAAFGGWLKAIARNAVKDVYRHAEPPAVTDADVPVASNHAHRPEAHAALAAIRALPRAYRETLLMRLVQGMTGPEIAERTGLTPGSVRVNLHRGMKLLRERLGQPQEQHS